jgi:hypothetical protein
MSAQAITDRLRQSARLLEERGFVNKGVDMSRAAVTRRLQSMAALSAMCLRLRRATIVSLAGELPARSGEPDDRLKP